MKCRFGFLGLFLILGACGERAGSGSASPIPQIVVNCKSASCKRMTTNAVATVLITHYDCNPNSFQFGLASSSFTMSCDSALGCYGTAKSWVNLQNQNVTTIPEGSYTICGRIDFNNTPLSYSDDSTAVAESTTISTKSQSPVVLTTWSGP